MPTSTPVLVVCHDIHEVNKVEFNLSYLPEIGEVMTIGKREWEVLLWIEGNADPELVIHVAPVEIDDPLALR
jgi:hypothetical protein